MLAKRPGDRAIDRLEQLPVEPGENTPDGVLLQPDDRARRPELVLGVVVAAVVERDVLPRLFGDLAENLAAALQQPRIRSGDSTRSITLCVWPRSSAAMSDGPISVPWLTG